MTEIKNKSEYLIELFRDYVNPYIGSGMLSNTHDNGVIRWQSKKCALILVDELMREIPPVPIGHVNPKWEFWNGVKSELKKEK